MSEVGDAIDEGRSAYAEVAADVMADLCDISVPGASVNAGDGTTTDGAPTTIEGVPCDFEPLSSYERLAGGAVTAGADFKFEFPVFWGGGHLNVPATATINVRARGLNPARSFGVTGTLPSSKKMKQKVAAKSG